MFRSFELLYGGLNFCCLLLIVTDFRIEPFYHFLKVPMNKKDK